MIHWFKKWRVVNSDKYEVIPRTDLGLYFKLTKEQQEMINDIQDSKGSVDFIFYPKLDLGYGVKVKVWNTNEYIDIPNVKTTI